jgi:hypothetical protein
MHWRGAAQVDVGRRTRSAPERSFTTSFSHQAPEPATAHYSTGVVMTEMRLNEADIEQLRALGPLTDDDLARIEAILARGAHITGDELELFARAAVSSMDKGDDQTMQEVQARIDFLERLSRALAITLN